MDILATVLWTAGAVVLGVIAVRLIQKMSRRPPTPEEIKEQGEKALELLLGPHGMAQSRQNLAADQKRHEAEMLAHATKSAIALRARGDVAGADKMDAYARTLPASIRGSGRVEHHLDELSRREAELDNTIAPEQICAICGTQIADGRRALGKHLWAAHKITPNDYRVKYLGLAPKCKRPGCENPVPRNAAGVWFKCCSPFCALEMGEDIPVRF